MTSKQSTGVGSRKEASESEIAAYIQWINHQLESDEDLADILPLTSNENDGVGKTTLFQGFHNGLLLAKIVNKIQPGLIDTKSLNKKPKGTLQMMENHNLALEGARKLGINLVNIGGTDLMEGTKHLILGITWQLIKLQLLKSVGDSGEVHDDQTSSSKKNQNSRSGQEKEQYLIDWVNKQLNEIEASVAISNFGKDIADGVVYANLLHALFPELVTDVVYSNYILEDKDPLIRAERVLQYSKQAGIQEFLAPQDIVTGNKNLNLAFTAMMFNAHNSSGPRNARHIEGSKNAEAQQQSHDECNRQILQLQEKIQLLEKQLEMTLESNTDLQEQLAQSAQSALEQRQILNLVESERDSYQFKTEQLEHKIKTLNHQTIDVFTKDEWDRKCQEMESSKRVALAALQSKLDQSNEANQALQKDAFNIKRKRDEIVQELETQNSALREKDDFLYRLRTILAFPEDIKDEEVFRHIREWEDHLEEITRKVEIGLVDLGILNSPDISKSTMTLSPAGREKTEPSTWTVSKRPNMGVILKELDKKTNMLTDQVALTRHGYRDKQNKEDDARDFLNTTYKQIENLYLTFKAALMSSEDIEETNFQSEQRERSYGQIERMQLWIKDVHQRLQSAESLYKTTEVEEQKELQFLSGLKSQFIQASNLLKSLGVANIASQQQVDRQRVESVLGGEARILVDQLFKVLSQSLQKLPSTLAVNASTQSLTSTMHSTNVGSTASLVAGGSAGHSPVVRQYLELFDILCHQQLNLISEFIQLKLANQDILKSKRNQNDNFVSQQEFNSVQKTLQTFLVNFRSNSTVSNDSMHQIKAQLYQLQRAASRPLLAASTEQSLHNIASGENLSVPNISSDASDENVSWSKNLLGLLEVIFKLVERNDNDQKVKSNNEDLMANWLGAASSLQQALIELLEKVTNNYVHYSMSVSNVLMLQEREGIREDMSDWTNELTQAQKDAQLQTTVLRSAVASLATVNLKRQGHRASVSNANGTPFQTSTSSLKDFVEQLKSVIGRYDTVAQMYQKVQGLLDSQFGHNLTFSSELSRAVNNCFEGILANAQDNTAVNFVSDNDDAENTNGIVLHLDHLNKLSTIFSDLNSNLEAQKTKIVELSKREALEREWIKQFNTLFGEDLVQLSGPKHHNGENVLEDMASSQDLLNRLSQFEGESASRGLVAVSGVCIVDYLKHALKSNAQKLQIIQELNTWKYSQRKQLTDMEDGLKTKSLQVKDTYETKLQECVKQINDLVEANERADTRYQQLFKKFQALSDEKQTNTQHWTTFSDYLKSVQNQILAYSETIATVSMPPVIKSRVPEISSSFELDKASAKTRELELQQLALESAQAQFNALCDLLSRYDSYSISLEAQLAERKTAEEKLLKKFDALSGQSDQAQVLVKQFQLQLEASLELVFEHMNFQPVLSNETSSNAQSRLVGMVQSLDKQLENYTSKIRNIGEVLQDGVEHIASLDLSIGPVLATNFEQASKSEMLHHLKHLSDLVGEKLALQTRRKLELENLQQASIAEIKNKDEEVSQFETTIETLSQKMDKVRTDLGHVREQKLDMMSYLTQVMGEQDRIVRACDNLHQTIQSKLQQHRTRTSSSNAISHQRNHSSSGSNDEDTGSSVSKLESSVESMLVAFQEQSATVQHLVDEMVRISADLEKVRNNYVAEVEASKQETSKVMVQVDTLYVQLESAKQEFTISLCRNKERTKLLRGLSNLAKRMTKVFPLSEEQNQAANSLLHQSVHSVSEIGLGIDRDGAPSLANLEVLVKLVQNLFDSASDAKQSFTRQITVLRDALKERDEHEKASVSVINRLVARTSTLLAQGETTEIPLDQVNRNICDSIIDGIEKTSGAAVLLSADLQQNRAGLTSAKHVDEHVAETHFDIYNMLIIAEEQFERLWERVNGEQDKYDLKIQELQVKLSDNDKECFASVKQLAQLTKEAVWLLFQISNPALLQQQQQHQQVSAELLSPDHANVLHTISSWTKGNFKLGNLFSQASGILKKEIKQVYKLTVAKRNAMQSLSAEIKSVQSNFDQLVSNYGEAFVYVQDFIDGYTKQLDTAHSTLRSVVDQNRNRVIGLMNERNRAQWQYEAEVNRHKSFYNERTKFNQEMDIMQGFLKSKFQRLENMLNDNENRNSKTNAAEDDEQMLVSTGDWTASKVAQEAEVLGLSIEKIETTLSDHLISYKVLFERSQKLEKQLQEAYQSQHSTQKQFEHYRKTLANGLSQTHSSLDLPLGEHKSEASVTTLVGSASNDSRSSLAFSDEVLRLANDSGGLVNILQELERGVKSVRTRCQVLENEISEKNKQEKNLEYVLKQTHRDYQKLMDQYKSLETEKSELLDLNQTTQSDANYLQQQAKLLESECHKLLEEKNDLKRKMNNLQAQLVNQSKLLSELELCKQQLARASENNLLLSREFDDMSLESAKTVSQLHLKISTELERMSVDASALVKDENKIYLNEREDVLTVKFEAMNAEEKRRFLRGEMMVTSELLHVLFETLEKNNTDSLLLHEREKTILDECEQMARGVKYILGYINDGSDEETGAKTVAMAFRALRQSLKLIMGEIGEATAPEATDKAFDLRKKLSHIKSICRKCEHVILDKDLNSEEGLARLVAEDEAENEENGLYDPSQIPWKSIDHFGYVSDSGASNAIRDIILSLHDALHNKRGAFVQTPDGSDDCTEESSEEIIAVLERATAFDSRLEILKERISRLAQERNKWYQYSLLKQVRIENLEAFINFIQNVRSNFGELVVVAGAQPSPLVTRLQRMKNEILQLRGLIQTSCTESNGELDKFAKQSVLSSLRVAKYRMLNSLQANEASDVTLGQSLNVAAKLLNN